MEPPSPPKATPSSAVRVLSRTPPPSTSSSGADAAASPSHDGGVVVVGFVGCAGSAARLADRILDAPVFSPGGSARTLAGAVRYHRDGERRMVFLHLAPPPPPLEAGQGSSGGGDLPELLFMFSVSVALALIKLIRCQSNSEVPDFALV
jgi:protein SMG8